MWNKLLNVLGFDWYRDFAWHKDYFTEPPFTTRAGFRLECRNNRHYWKLLVFLPGEPCNCGLYAYQPDEPSGFKTIDTTKE